MTSSQTLNGIAVSPGIAIARAQLYIRPKVSVNLSASTVEDIEAECKRFEEAILKSEKQIRKITAVAREKIGADSAEVFEAQLLMLRDEMVYPLVVRRIKQQSVCAEEAIEKVFTKHRNLLEASENKYLQERAHDLLDVQERLIRNLQRQALLSKIEENRIVVAESLTAADMILFSRRNVKGCVMDFGGATSHTAILARSLDVPAIVGKSWESQDYIQQDDLLILDGLNGKLIINPTPQELHYYQEKLLQYQWLAESRRALVPLSSETTDGTSILLRANLDIPEELPFLMQNGAEGVGLFRTEMSYLTSGTPLSEAEQFDTYTAVAAHCAPNPVTVRLIDLGGDKLLPMGHHEHNPFLGWRGIRILLDKPELLKPQIRAILRAAAHGNIRLMAPMITTVQEVLQLRKIIQEMAFELQQHNEVYKIPPIGIMVEVPAVALMAEAFAKEVDFFSIGSNDLTQYTLAVDRGNDLVSDLYQEYHPAVLQLIQRAVLAADNAQISVGICGELAAQPRAVPLLVGLGIREFSASPIFLPEVKRIIRSISIEEAEQLANNALKLPDGVAVQNYMTRWMKDKRIEWGQFFDA